MSFPGEYPQPLARKTMVHCPVISGYVTARLQTQEIFTSFAGSIGNNLQMQCLFENVGTTQFTVKLRETNDRSVSGTRSDITSPITLVAGGMKTVNTTGTQTFLEIYGTDGSGNLRMTIESQRKWTELGFAKDDPFYPPQLFQAKTSPGPS